VASRRASKPGDGLVTAVTASRTGRGREAATQVAAGRRRRLEARHLAASVDAAIGAAGDRSAYRIAEDHGERASSRPGPCAGGLAAQREKPEP